MKEMDESQIKNKYLHAAVIKLKNILKKIDIDVDIPTQNHLNFFKWTAKKAIRAAILLVFSILTIISCSDLLWQYINGVTTTKIEVNKNGSVPFPSSTVCLPTYGITINIFDEHFTIENASQYLHAEVSEYFENQEHLKETFLNGSLWSPAMFFVALGYVTGLHVIENYEWTMDTTTNFSEYKIQLQGNGWWEAAIILEKGINILNISISELTEAVGQAFAMKFNLRVTHYSAYDGLIHPSYFSYNTSYIGGNWICYNVDFSGLAITSQDELIVVDFYASLDITLDETVLRNEQYVVLFAPSADFHMDLKTLINENTGDLPSLVMNQFRARKNYYLGTIGYDNYISYDLIQMYRFMPIINGRQQCSEIQSTEVCRAECRASLIKNMCNCTAATLTTPEDMSSECTLTSYEKCSVADANNDLMCDCLKQCTRWDYEIKEMAVHSSYPSYSGSIIIRLAKLDYRIFEQTYLWKLEGFIGAFGGALSLWLGIDFIMAINFFFIVVAKLIKMISKSKQPSSSNAVINQEHTYLKEQGDTHKENPAVGKKEIEKRTADELLTIIAFKPSSWSCIKVLSLIVNLIFSLATVIMCIRLFQQYLSDPPIIVMSVPYDATFELPKLTEIVFPMYRIDLKLNINKTLYGEKVDEYFGQEQMNKEAFLNRTDAWPPEILALCFKYLAYLSAGEGTDLEDWNTDTMSFSDQAGSWNLNFLRESYSGEFFDAAFQLENKLSQMGVTIKELKLSVAEKLKSAFQLSVTYVYTVDGVVRKENVSIIENTCINEARVCFKADFSNKPIRSPDDYIEISSRINQSILPIDNTMINKLEIIVDFDGQIMRDIFNFDEDIVNMVGNYGFLTIFKVFTIDVYRRIPSVKGETQCISYEKNDQCRWQCRSEMIYKKCNCTTVSLSLPYLPEGPECSFTIYNKCLQYSKQDDLQCINRCLKPCEKWKYQVDMEKRMLLKKENEAIIQMQVKKFDYVMYTEKLPWTYETFAGAIGGALGLWLGLDFVIMIGAISEILGYILPRLFHTLGLKKMNAGTQVPDQVQANESSKKHQEESNNLYFTSATMKWSKKSFKMLIKGLYSMKLGVILKLIVIKIFWGYLVVLFCFLTFNMCFLLIKQYLKNPTTTNMQFLLNNTFNMPTSTLCVPVSLYSLDTMLGSPNTAHYESMMMEYFAQNQGNKEAFFKAINNKWSLEVYAIIFVYLFTFGKAEGFSLNSNDPCPIDLTSSRLCSYYFPLWENEWKAIFFELEVILKRMNVSRGELLQSFGQQTLKIYDISILYIAEEKKHSQSHIEIRETSSVDYNSGVCFKINFSGAAIRSEAELFNISVNSNGLHDDNWNAIIFDMNGRYKPETRIYKTIFGFFGLRTRFIIGANEFDNIFPGRKEDPDCNESVSPDICRSECRASLIRRFCNCTAASLPTRKVSPLSDECTLATYQNCLKYYAVDDFECRKNCLRSCKRETYQWKLYNNYVTGYANVTNLILKVEDFGYAVFEEDYEWTFEKFLGEFGGNLGLWIGLDIKMVLGEIFSIVFVIGRPLIAFIRAKIAGNAVIVI